MFLHHPKTGEIMRLKGAGLVHRPNLHLTDAIRATLSTAVEAPVKPPLNAPQTREEAFAAHRRAHRSGRPAKIEGDPELEAFIIERIAVMTYSDIVASLTAHFPPDLLTSNSAVQRPFRKRHNGGAGRPAIG